MIGQPGQARGAVAAGYSEHPETPVAVGEVIGDVLGRIDSHPDVAVLFVSGRFVRQLEAIVAAVHSLLAPETLIGADVPTVFDGTEGRPSDAALLLWAAHFRQSGQATVARFDPADPEAGWHGQSGAALGPDGVTLVLGEPAVPVAGLPGSVVGVGGSAGGGLVLDRTCHRRGAVAVQLPAGAASSFDFVLPLWDDLAVDDGDINDGINDGINDDDGLLDRADLHRHGELFDPGPGAGLLLFAGRGNRAPMGARFDFELALDRFNGAVGGAMAPVVWSPSPPDRPDMAGRAICGLVMH